MMMIESVQGNVEDPVWKIRLEDAQVDVLNLDQWQAQKNRFRRQTEGGVDLAVALDRSVHLRDGDILCWDETVCKAIIVRIQLKDVMVINLAGLLSESPEILARTCVELGHGLGNQHWPAVVKETKVYVPLTVSQQVMASVMKTHAFAGISFEFIPGEDLIPYLAPHEARRLFGGADSSQHSDTHAHEHTHGTEQSHVHHHAD